MKIFTRPIGILTLLLALGISFTSCLEEKEDLCGCEEVEYKCFEHVYPLDVILGNETVVTLNNDGDMEAQYKEIVDFVYPFEIVYDQGKSEELVKTINNEEEYKLAWEACKGYEDDCDHDDDKDNDDHKDDSDG